jgi:hypothetical protein
MHSLNKTQNSKARIRAVTFSGDFLKVIFDDRRILLVPLEWYPRLANATEAERLQCRIIGNGTGINWPIIDEDLDAEGLLAGAPSPEYLRGKNNA